MKDEIKVGDYVRLNRNQGINKIIEIEDDSRYILENEIADENGEITDCICKYDLEDEILNYKTNIIDLIEEGDIIVLKDGRKYEVLKMSWSKLKGRHIHIINPLRLEGGKDIFIDDIKSIVTKEQFKSIEYEI